MIIGGHMKLEEKYPFIASWVVDGQIQIGQADSYHEPLAAIIDAGEPCGKLKNRLIHWMIC